MDMMTTPTNIKEAAADPLAGEQLTTAVVRPAVYLDYLQDDQSIDVIHPSLLAHYGLFFGPAVPGTKPYVTDKTNLGAILADLGLAESRGWARKNGWWRDCPAGLHEVVFSKKKFRLWLLVSWKPGGEEP